MGCVPTYQKTASRVNINTLHIFVSISILHPFGNQWYFTIKLGGDPNKRMNILMMKFGQGRYSFNHTLTRSKPFAKKWMIYQPWQYLCCWKDYLELLLLPPLFFWDGVTSPGMQCPHNSDAMLLHPIRFLRWDQNHKMMPVSRIL